MTTQSNTFHIVGIGASAGGLEALEKFFTAMPADGGMAFVVIQHLSPDYKSHMVELLSKYTTMPVHEATDGMTANPNNIYLLPRRKNVTISEGKLFLVDYERTRSLNLPIDIFFESLAKDQGELAIAIILSGTGSDGTRGLRAVKESGGMVMAQDDSAKFDGMPHSAISTQLVDYILPAEKMPESLLSYVHHPCLATDPNLKPPIAKEEDQMARLFAVLRDSTGMDFTDYKSNTIVRRIERRMSINQIDRLSDYVDYVQHSLAEANALFKEFLIGVTRFFRDLEAFELIEHEIIPALIKEKPPRSQIRVWVAGCSTGEEAYSLAILFREYMERSGQLLDVKIFATDIDKRALEFASQGTYPESILGDVTQTRLNDHFERKGDTYEISRHIRSMVVFANQNLIKDPPFSKMDLISCRNMLIYLQAHLQRKILSTFQFALNTGGFLFLGASETVADYADVFVSKNNKWKIYQYQGGPIPILEHARLSDLENSGPGASGRGYRTQGAADDWRSSDPVLRSMVEQLLPPCVVIDENGSMIHAFGEIDKYLQAPRGFRVNLNIKNLIRPDLVMPLSTALHRATKSREEVIYRNIVFKDGNESHQIHLATRPFWEKGSNNRLILVTFMPVEANEETAVSAETFDINKTARQRISDLEQELQYTRENLQATIEELETANEELQATNEELLAANEELQSTNEELQSVNEELITVNNEYQLKIAELTALNDDVNNLLKSTDIGTIFLDAHLNLRKFTPTAQADINLLDQDVGRPFSHITHNFINLDFTPLAQDVLQSLKVQERQIQSRSGKWYQLRALPYRTHANQIDGVVLTLVNITRLKEAERRAEHLGRAKNYLDMVSTLVVALDNRGEITFINRTGADLLHASQSELSGQHWYSTYLPKAEQPAFKTTLDQLLSSEIQEAYFEGQLIISTDELRLMRWEFQPLYNDLDEVRGILGSGVDITEQRAFETALQASEERLAAAIEIGGAGIYEHSVPPGPDTYQSERWAEILGYTQAELPAGSTFMKWLVRQIHPDDLPMVDRAYTDFVEGRAKTYQVVMRIKHKAGHWLVVEGLSKALQRDEHGRVRRLIGVMRDITRRKQIEAALTESEARYRAMAHNLPNGALVMFDHDLRFMLADGTELAELGLDPEDFEGKYLRDIYPDERGKWLAENYRRALAGETLTLNYKRDDGRFYVLHIAPLKDSKGQIYAGLVLSQNITQIIEAEREMVKSEERLRVALKHSPVRLYQTDRQLRYVWVLTSDEAKLPHREVGQTIFESGLNHDDALRLAEIKRTVMANNEGTRQIVNLSLDGEECTFDLMVEPLHDNEGEIIGITAAEVDITERQRP